eukprot:Hpha_TRINITY_DN34827_c0_g1::TRINITY_DN34827_c0_g1_i1::g.167765::m.167765
MVFSVRVATDIFGIKYNRAFEFPQRPLMRHLINVVESHFDILGRARRPTGCPDKQFRAHTFQLYDELLDHWADLFSSEQLTDTCQLCCFQPESLWHSDLQEAMPPAEPTEAWCTPESYPARSRRMDEGVSPLLMDKMKRVFTLLHRREGEALDITMREFIQGLERAGMRLVNAHPQQLFATMGG